LKLLAQSQNNPIKKLEEMLPANSCLFPARVHIMAIKSSRALERKTERALQDVVSRGNASRCDHYFLSAFGGKTFGSAQRAKPYQPACVALPLILLEGNAFAQRKNELPPLKMINYMFPGNNMRVQIYYNKHVCFFLSPFFCTYIVL
jgi:hypothetical protein